MTELNGCDPIKIKVLGPYTFSIGNTSDFTSYASGGIVTQVKMPITMTFKTLAEAESAPELMVSDFAKFDHPGQIQMAFTCLHRFVAKYGRKPRQWNQEDATLFVALCKERAAELKIDTDEKLLSIFSKVCIGDLCPVNAGIGGITAQEVMKACTGKFTPIFQYFTFDAIECLPPNDPTEADCQGLAGRYDGQIAVFGRQFQDKLGALRCV
jgi:ubiquitin-activating enzyme E1